MSDVNQPQEVLNELVDQWEFKPGDEERVYGEIQGSPVTMTVLGATPLSLLLAFKIVSPHPEAIELPEEIEDLVDDQIVEVTFNDGIAWLSLYDLSGETSDSIVELVGSFVEALSVAGLTFPPGCVSCGNTDDTHLMYLEGRCSRLCTSCVDGLLQEQEQAQEALNSASSRHAIGLPLAFLYVSGGWLLFWYLIDLILAWRNTNEIVVPGVLGMLVLAVFLGAIGFGLGYPLGIFLRRSGLARRSPLVISLPAIALACVVGEWFYITAVILRQFGVFDMLAAARLFVTFVQSYEGSWLALKVCVVCGIVWGCHVSATAKKTVPLKI